MSFLHFRDALPLDVSPTRNASFFYCTRCRCWREYGAKRFYYHTPTYGVRKGGLEVTRFWISLTRIEPYARTAAGRTGCYAGTPGSSLGRRGGADGRRVGRLAKDLPRFDSVWIDALAQARVLTPFQAAELNAGRGGALRVGPFLLGQRLAHPCYVASYRAKNVESAEMVRLAVVENAGQRADAILGQLRSLMEGGSCRGGSATGTPTKS